jgi:hypothetical protein
MEHWRVLGEGRGDVKHFWQVVVFNGEGRDAFLGRGHGVRGYCRYALADEADSIPGEHGPVLQSPAGANAHGVGTGYDRPYSGDDKGRLNVDLAYDAMRNGAGHVPHVQRAWDTLVSGVARSAGHFVPAVDPLFGRGEALVHSAGETLATALIASTMPV